MSEATQPKLPEQDLQQIVRSTDGCWGELRGGRILITGATGFFGVWLLESLGAINRELNLGLTIVAQSRAPAAFLRRVPHLGPETGIRWIEAAPAELDAGAVRAAVGGGGGVDAVVHLVTEADNAAMVARPDQAEETIVGSTRVALALARDVGARHFLLASSGAVYRPDPMPERLGEGHPLIDKAAALASGHAIGGYCKRQAEELCVAAAQASALRTSIARCFTFAGPGMPLRGKFALGNFLDDALNGRDIVIQSDGRAVRSYLYAADLATWLWAVMLRGGPGRAYNVGSMIPVTIRETAAAVRDALAPELAVTALGASGTGAAHYVPDTRRAETELGLRETVGLVEAIRRTAAWVRKDTRH